MTERLIDFIADAPYLLEITFPTISFNFLSPSLSRVATLKVMSPPFAAAVFFCAAFLVGITYFPL
jgi:hypothetical protein